MDKFLQQLINGISLGSIYALIALGYTMVYGIINLINFAHGEVYMLGAFIGFFLITKLKLGFLPALMLAMIACSIIGIVIEKVAYKPIRNSTRIAALITAISVSCICFIPNSNKYRHYRFLCSFKLGFNRYKYNTCS
ncbi:MAG: branched-chain amino acid ABC transporter permease [Clostridium cochlearium]|nr:branched-chain amino acid ABC transporter permease [Clostridium cochlearium]